MLALGILSIQVASAQTISVEQAKAEIRKITLAYKNCKQLSVNAYISYYKKTTDVKPVNKDAFTVKLKGGKVYYKMNSMERVSNMHQSIIVDHRDKILILDKGTDLSVKGDPAKVFQHDEVLRTCTSIQSVSIDGDSKAFVFNFEKNKYKSITIQYNLKTHYIEKATMVFNGNGKPATMSVIEYVSIDDQTLVDDSFDLSRYIVYNKKMKAFSPAKQFADYEFINHINNN